MPQTLLILGFTNNKTKKYGELLWKTVNIFSTEAYCCHNKKKMFL